MSPASFPAFLLPKSLNRYIRVWEPSRWFPGSNRLPSEAAGVTMAGLQRPDACNITPVRLI